MSFQSIPRHVAIIMDGNGRWAQNKLFPRTRGHIAGRKSLRIAIESAVEFGVKRLTVFAFGRENWNRPKEEVDQLMLLLTDALVEESAELSAKQIRLLFVGDRTRLDPAIVSKIEYAEAQAACGEVITLVVAIDYSGQWEIAQLFNFIRASGAVSQEKSLSESDLDYFAIQMGMEPIDLLIRTSGEYRLSNFMLWQCAYAELYFTGTLWPDFGRQDFISALESYNARQRRFGKIAEQLTK